MLGGIRNQLAIYAAKALIFCNINPNDSVQAYAPDPAVFGDEYITEKIETKAGWTFPQPDEDWMTGYPPEIQDFVESVAFGREPLSGGALARDVVAVTYARVSVGGGGATGGARSAPPLSARVRSPATTTGKGRARRRAVRLTRARGPARVEWVPPHSLAQRRREAGQR